MSESGNFDLRFHVHGTDKFDVWRRVAEFWQAVAALEVPGVVVRYTQIRDPRSRDFPATMTPAPRKRKQAA